MKLEAWSRTDIGSRNSNEDSYYADQQQGLFIVADGMGGHAAGEIASQMAVDAVREYWQTSNINNPLELLQQAVEKANQAVKQAADDNPSWQGMGTTLTILLLQQGRGYITHVGDSRIYRLRNQQLEQLSDDHSLVGEQLRRGIITAEQAKTSNFGNVLLQAIGVTPTLDICQAEFSLQAGDQFLLCSDGLTNMVKDKTIAVLLNQPKALSSNLAELMEKAITTKALKHDNITAILLQIEQL